MSSQQLRIAPRQPRAKPGVAIEVASPGEALIRFGDCTIDAQRREFRASGRVVALQPLVYKLLHFLASNPGRAIPKGDLLLAVWGTLHVTDAVLATAIRKLRRAVGDTDLDTSVIATVRGFGYRFDAQVQSLDDDQVGARVSGESGKSGGRLAVLRFVNATGNANLDWFERGLAILLHDKLEQSGKLRLVALESSLGWMPPAAGAIELEAACRSLGSDWALSCRLEHIDHGLRLRAHWGAREATATVWHADGQHEAALVEQLAAALLERPAAAPSSQHDFWEGQIAFVSELEQRGQSEQALQVLQACLQHLQPSPRTTLLHARLLRQRMALNSAREVLQAACAGSVAPGLVVLRPWLLSELAEVELLDGHVASAQRACDDALDLIVDGGGAADALSDVLSTASRIDFVRGEYHSSAQKALRAKAAAESAHNSAANVTAAIAYSRAVYMEGSPRLALDALQDAAELARVSGLAGLEADVYLQLAFQQSSRWRHSQAIDYARRSAVLASAQGNRATWHRAQVREMIALAEVGRVGDAAALADRHFDGSIGWHSTAIRDNQRMIRWTLDWRSGRSDAAIALLEQVLAETPTVEVGRRRIASYRLMICLLATGQLERAKQIFDLYGQVGYLTRTGHLRAAFAMASGDRDEAAHLLRGAWLTGPLHDAETWHAVESLAWMALEDRASTLAPALARDLSELSSEQASIALVLYLSELRFGTQSWDLPRWQMLVRANHGLVHRHGWLLEEPACLAWLRGEGPKLGVLFTDACY